MTTRRDKLFEPSDDDSETAASEPQSGFQSRAPRAGADFKTMALRRVRQAGSEIVKTDFEIDGFPVDALVRGENGCEFLVLARGTPDDQARGGLRRTDTVLKLGFVAVQLARRQDLPILIVTSDIPEAGTQARRYLAALSDDVWDVVAHRADLRGFHRLQSHLRDAVPVAPGDAPWRFVVPPNAAGDDRPSELPLDADAESEPEGGMTDDRAGPPSSEIS